MHEYLPKEVILHLDNSGENSTIPSLALEQNLNLKFEFTAPHTPQQNGVVERGFPTIAGRARAMMNDANFSDELKGLLWAEAFQTATLLDSILSTDGKTTPWDLFYKGKKKPLFLDHLQCFGEVAYVADRSKFKTKLQNHSNKMIFVGYSIDHAGDVYRFYNPTSKTIIQSRDVTQWTGKTWSDPKHDYKLRSMYGTQAQGYQLRSKGSPTFPVSSVMLFMEATHNLMAYDDEVAKYKAKRQNCVTKHVKFKDPISSIFKTEATSEKSSKTVAETVKHLKAAPIPITIPQNYRGMLKSPEIHDWLIGQEKEFQNMESKEVWIPEKLEDIPSDQLPIGTRWVYDLKDQTIFRARLVALGYNQVHGIDWNNSASLVVNDITLRICLALFVYHEDWVLKQFDVETAFLYGDLDETIYLKCPDGYDLDPDYILKLNKAIYGLIQAALQWYKTFAKFLLSENFKRTLADPCLFIRKDELGTYIIPLYIDDSFGMGNEQAVNNFLIQFRKHFVIKEIKEIKSFLDMCIKMTKDKIKLTQPKLIDSIIDSFTLPTQSYATPT